MKKATRALLAIAVAVIAAVSLLTFTACKCNHEWSEWTVLTAATCETDGVQTRKCSKCDSVEIDKVEALGHEDVIDEAVAATCTETGLTEGKHCGRCDKVLVKQEVVKALGHEFTEYNYNNDATCLQDGTKTAKCNRCDQTDTLTAENTALGHEEVIDDAVAATCTETGLTEGKHCGRCNDVLIKQQVLPAIGHNNKNGICLICNKDISTKGLEYLDGIEENTCIVAGIGSATDKDIIIPATYNGKRVVQIGKNAFSNKRITSIEIADSVTSIGESAFSACGGLTSITLSNSVTSIGDYAFVYCSSLTSITIPNSVTSIGEFAFSYCRSLTSITIGSGVTSIGIGAFFYCRSLTSIMIPNGVTSIGWGAFSGCSSLVEILVEESNKSFKSIDGDLYTKDAKTFIQYAQGKKQTSFALAEGVTSIGDNSFSWCSSLTSITIGSNVTSIGDYAFYNCSSLTQVNYKGTAEQWNKIHIGNMNDDLTRAKRNYI